jgi:hypoxanthine phosphoribosyltransferase
MEKSVTINSEFKKFEVLFLLLKESVILGDKIQDSITPNGIKELKQNANEIKKHLRAWGVFGNKDDTKRLDEYYVMNYENNILDKCKYAKSENLKYKCDVLEKRSLGKHLNFLRVIFEECNNQLKLLQKISDKPQKLYLKKLLLSISEFRRVMKFFPLDKAYKFHASRINVQDLKDFLKEIKIFSEKYSINTFAITEKSARLIGELLEKNNLPQKIIYYTPDPITREKIKNPKMIFKKEFPKIKTKDNNLLVIDEYIQTGDTLKISKKFFKKIGFRNVYSCTMYLDESCKYFPDFFIKKTFLAPPWYDFPIMLKEKVEGSFKTIPLKIKSKFLKKELQNERQKMIDSLIKKIRL